MTPGGLTECRVENEGIGVGTLVGGGVPRYSRRVVLGWIRSSLDPRSRLTGELVTYGYLDRPRRPFSKLVTF